MIRIGSVDFEARVIKLFVGSRGGDLTWQATYGGGTPEERRAWARAAAHAANQYGLKARFLAA